MTAKSSVDDQKVLGEQPKTTISKKAKEQSKAARQFSHDKENQKLSMQVRIRSPFRDYYDGPAFSLSAENATGPFDILPHHHNFISLLVPCEVAVRTAEDREVKIQISGGIMNVKADQVSIFLDV